MTEYKSKRGAALVMSIMAITLSFMLLATLLQTTGMTIANSSSFYDREAALQAAQSGLDYAITRLQSNMNWRGNANETVGSLNDGFIVRDSHGNVVGLMKNSANNISAFRIKFNFEISSVDEAFKEKIIRNLFIDKTGRIVPPDAGMSIDMPYVSVNNFSNHKEILLFRANNNGVGVNNRGKKIPNSELYDVLNGEDSFFRNYANHVSPQHSCVIVEGIAGRGLRNCKKPADLCDASKFRADAVTRRYVEAYLNPNLPAFKGYAAYAADNMTFNLKKTSSFTGVAYIHSGGNLLGQQTIEDDDEDKSTLPKRGYLRSDRKIQVNDGVLNTFNGAVYSGDGAKFNDDETTYKFNDSNGKERDYTFTTSSRSTKGLNPMEEIDEDEDLPLAKNTINNHMEPGFYEWHKSAANPEFFELRYYGNQYQIDKDTNDPSPKKPKEYKLAVNIGDIQEKGLDPAKYVEVAPVGKFSYVTDEEGNITEPTVNFRGNLYCNGSLVISSYKNVNDVGNFVDKCPRVNFNDYDVYDDKGEPIEDKNEACLLTTKDDCMFLASVTGSGAVTTTGGDVTFVGKSLLEANADGVAIYGNEVNLESVDRIMNSATISKLKDKLKGKVKIINDTTASFELDADKILAICSKYKNNQSQCQDELKKYLENNYSMKDVSVFGFAPRETSDSVPENYGFSIKSGVVQYWIHPYSAKRKHHWHSENKIKYWRNDTEYNKLFFHLTSFDFGNEGNEYLQLLQRYKKLSYGDQCFTGAIYAKKNFNINLNKRFNLIIKGAVRAQHKINASCSNIDIDYDERYISKLFNVGNKVTCDIWNCW